MLKSQLNALNNYYTKNFIFFINDYMQLKIKELTSSTGAFLYNTKKTSYCSSLLICQSLTDVESTYTEPSCTVLKITPTQ